MMMILIPTDGSAAALAAVRRVITLRDEGLNLRCVLANVQDQPHLYEVVLAHDVQVLAAAGHAAAEDAMDPARELLARANIPTECVIAAGNPGPRLVELAEAQGCEAIVMGSQGHGWLGQPRLGPVTQWVLTHAEVPVTVVRHEEE